MSTTSRSSILLAKLTTFSFSLTINIHVESFLLFNFS